MKDSYTEAEAARFLGISLADLHELLDRHIFNEGSRRPANIEFTGSDLLLLAYWNKEDQPAAGAARDNVVPIQRK